MTLIGKTLFAGIPHLCKGRLSQRAPVAKGACRKGRSIGMTFRLKMSYTRPGIQIHCVNHK